MRSMLISLILFCSLRQFAISQPPPTPERKVHASLKGCGKTYSCFVPAICAEDGETGVKKVKEDKKIHADCAAIVRFHLYSQSRAYVSIESLKTEALEIKLYHQTEDAKHLAEFSCKKVNGPEAGTFIMEKGFKRVIKLATSTERAVLLTPSQYYLTESKRNEDKPKENKMKCAFEIRLKDKKQKIFDTEYTGVKSFIFDIDGAKTNADEQQVGVNCNPPTIKNIITADTARKYKMATQGAGKYTCEFKKDNINYPAIYKMAYRMSPKEEFKYEIADLTCADSDFYADSSKIANKDTDYFEITCAADAYFFCNDVKTPDRLRPDQKKPLFVGADLSKTPPRKSTLKCPQEYPHLVVVKGEREKIYENANFICESHGVDTVWKIENTNETLTKKAPEVYCTNKLTCNMLPDSIVKDGFVDNSEPRCFLQGTPSVKIEGEYQTLNGTKCDDKLGKFKYFVGNKEHVVDERTKFECRYPAPKDENFQKQTDKILVGSVAAFAGTGAVAVVLLGLITYLGYRQAKKDKEKRRLAQLGNKAAWQKYCLDEDEREAYKEEDHEKSANAPDEPFSWSAMLMSFQHNALGHTKKEVDNEWKFAFVNRENDKIAFNKTEENSHKSVAISRAKYAGPNLESKTPEYAILKDEYTSLMSTWWTKEKKRGRNWENVTDV